MASVAEGVWEAGRFDARGGSRKLLFGQMHEDSSIEASAFRPGGRIFCIASAGCTAMELSRRHDVVAVDVNPEQTAYARRRFSGGTARRGAAERFMAFARALQASVGWRRSTLFEFLELADPAEQVAFWRRRLDTRRFRLAMHLILSKPVLGLFYARPLLDCLPDAFGRVMRARMERCFARHPNRSNPYARALLLGELPEAPPPPEAARIRVVHSEAAAYLEREPPGRFDGFTLSNILDGTEETHRRRLAAAVRQAAAPGAVVVVRSFSEPRAAAGVNLAAEDRSILWGVVQVKPAAELESGV